MSNLIRTVGTPCHSVECSDLCTLVLVRAAVPLVSCGLVPRLCVVVQGVNRFLTSLLDIVSYNFSFKLFNVDRVVSDLGVERLG